MSLTFRGIGMTSQRTRDRLVERLEKDGISDTRVLQAMRSVPRHIFVDEALASRAYEDSALPIGFGQTISQPYIVARMTEALLGDFDARSVLEIGTGCGYQTAVLALLVKQVFSIERIAELQNTARERMNVLGLQNVRMMHGDGYAGWPSRGPFDAVLVTAAPADGIPAALLEQLCPGGRLVIPVGKSGNQNLLLVCRTESGFEQRILEKVSFVPLIGGTG